MPDLTKRQQATHFRSRRRMAWLSFWLLVIVGCGSLAIGLSSDAAATRIEKLSFLIGTLFGCWVTVVAAYFGASSLVDARKMD